MYGTLTMLESRLGEYPPLDSSSSSISTICGHLWQPPSLFILAVFQRAQILIINSFNRQVDFTCIFIPFILQQDERANKICRLATWPHWMSAWCTFCLEVYGRGIIIFSFFVRGQLGCEYVLHIQRIYRPRGSQVFLLTFWFRVSIGSSSSFTLYFALFLLFGFKRRLDMFLKYEGMLLVEWKRKIIIILKDYMHKEWTV